MKLSTIHYQYMGELHAKFYQNWWSGFRDISGQDTEGHSFIIIRILREIDFRECRSSKTAIFAILKALNLSSHLL